MIRSTLLLLFCVLLSPTTAPGSGKAPAAYIGFHPEGAEVEGPKMVRPDVIHGEKHYFRVSPDLVIRHFSAFRAFQAEDGASYGVALKLNEDGLRAQEVMVSTYQGKLVRVLVNNRAVDTLRIDRVKSDGWLIIWQGLGDKDLELIAKKLRRLDKPMREKR